MAVAVNSTATATEALELAAAVAMRNHALMTLIVVVPRPWPTVALAGVHPFALERDAIVEASETLRHLTGSLPPELPFTTHIRCGTFGRQLTRIANEQNVDVLIVAAPSSGRLIGSWARRTVRRLARQPFELIVADREPDRISAGPASSETST